MASDIDLPCQFIWRDERIKQQSLPIDGNSKTGMAVISEIHGASEMMRQKSSRLKYQGMNNTRSFIATGMGYS